MAGNRRRFVFNDSPEGVNTFQTRLEQNRARAERAARRLIRFEDPQEIANEIEYFIPQPEPPVDEEENVVPPPPNNYDWLNRD